MGRVWKKSGSGGFGYTRIFKCRVRVSQVLKKVGFGRVISGLDIPGPITIDYIWFILIFQVEWPYWWPCFWCWSTFSTRWRRTLQRPRALRPLRPGCSAASCLSLRPWQNMPVYCFPEELAPTRMLKISQILRHTRTHAGKKLWKVPNYSLVKSQVIQCSVKVYDQLLHAYVVT